MDMSMSTQMFLSEKQTIKQNQNPTKPNIIEKIMLHQFKSSGSFAPEFTPAQIWFNVRV